MFWKIQEICNKMGTRICKIVEEMAEIIEPKVGNPKNSVSRNWAILSYPWNLIFFRMRFSNFFLNYMIWKYQNEIAPIFYYGISTKTNEKDLKIPNLQPPDWKSPYWMTLYYHYSSLHLLHSLLFSSFSFRWGPHATRDTFITTRVWSQKLWILMAAAVF